LIDIIGIDPSTFERLFSNLKGKVTLNVTPYVIEKLNNSVLYDKEGLEVVGIGTRIDSTKIVLSNYMPRSFNAKLCL
jgi:hypothetical protein